MPVDKEWVEDTVKSMGPATVDLLTAWIPQASKAEILKLVKESDQLDFFNGKISWKAESNIEGDQSPDQRPTTGGLSPQSAQNSKITAAKPDPDSSDTQAGEAVCFQPEQITLQTIRDMISLYNSRVEQRYAELLPDNNENKIGAVTKYLYSRYRVDNFCKNEFDHIYTLYHKVSNTEVGYAVIVENLTKKTVLRLKEVLGDETVFIYVMGNIEVGVEDFIERDVNGFYVKGAKAIIDQFVERYRIDAVQETILEIVKEE